MQAPLPFGAVGRYVTADGSKLILPGALILILAPSPLVAAMVKPPGVLLTSTLPLPLVMLTVPALPLPAPLTSRLRGVAPGTFMTLALRVIVPPPAVVAPLADASRVAVGEPAAPVTGIVSVPPPASRVIAPPGPPAAEACVDMFVVAPILIPPAPLFTTEIVPPPAPAPAPPLAVSTPFTPGLAEPAPILKVLALLVVRDIEPPPPVPTPLELRGMSTNRSPPARLPEESVILAPLPFSPSGLELRLPAALLTVRLRPALTDTSPPSPAAEPTEPPVADTLRLLSAPPPTVRSDVVPVVVNLTMPPLPVPEALDWSVSGPTPGLTKPAPEISMVPPLPLAPVPLTFIVPVGMVIVPDRAGPPAVASSLIVPPLPFVGAAAVTSPVLVNVMPPVFLLMMLTEPPAPDVAPPDAPTVPSIPLAVGPPLTKNVVALLLVSWTTPPLPVPAPPAPPPCALREPAMLRLPGPALPASNI